MEQQSQPSPGSAKSSSNDSGVEEARKASISQVCRSQYSNRSETVKIRWASAKLYKNHVFESFCRDFHQRHCTCSQNQWSVARLASLPTPFRPFSSSLSNWSSMMTGWLGTNHHTLNRPRMPSKMFDLVQHIFPVISQISAPSTMTSISQKNLNYDKNSISLPPMYSAIISRSIYNYDILNVVKFEKKSRKAAKWGRNLTFWENYRS